MNAYIKALKKVITDYALQYFADLEKEQKIEKYGNAEEKSTLGNIKDDMDRKYTNARIQIDSIRRNAIDEVEKRFEIKGSAITSDVELLNDKFNLEVADIDRLVKKYIENPTMLRAIESYIHKHNDMMINEYIPAKKDIEYSYASLSASADSIIAAIHENTTATREWLDLMIDKFGSDSEFVINPSTKLVIEGIY